METRNPTSVFPDSDEEYPTQNNLNQTDFSHTKPIVIESDATKQKFEEADSANHSFDDGVDVVDGLLKARLDDDQADVRAKRHGNSVDSGISNNGNGNHDVKNILNVKETEVPKLRSRVSDLSLKESEGPINKDSSSDEDKFEIDPELSPRLKTGGAVKRNGISLNLKFQSEMR